MCSAAIVSGCMPHQASLLGAYSDYMPYVLAFEASGQTQVFSQASLPLWSCCRLVWLSPVCLWPCTCLPHLEVLSRPAMSMPPSLFHLRQAVSELVDHLSGLHLSGWVVLSEFYPGGAGETFLWPPDQRGTFLLLPPCPLSE